MPDADVTDAATIEHPPTERDWDIPQLTQQIGEQYTKERLTNAWTTEQPLVETALRAIEQALPKGRYSPDKVLPPGGSGIVLRLRDSKFSGIDKALKFPRPVDGKIALLSEMLTKEIGYLSALKHPGIVSIVDYATIPDVAGYSRLPFYVMDFVDGKRSSEFVRSAISEEQFHRVVRETAHTLAYLHAGAAEPFAHLDLKAENIMVTQAGCPVLIDLGTCKRLRNEADKTIVACTRSNAHPHFIHYLQEDPSDNNRAKGELPRRDIKAVWDLWAFGLTLLDWLGVDRDTGAIDPDAIFGRFSSAYTRKYYLLLVARLLSFSPRAWITKRVGLSDTFLKDFPVETVDDLCEALDRLANLRNPLSLIPELATPSSGTIQAASEAQVATTPALGAVLSHRLYRRLGSITQLGLVLQVYPGAKHTRREHSLGTYSNVLRMIRALYDDSYSPFFKQMITEGDCRAVLLATLLHDIGHFPLAHDLEDVDRRFFSHAELTQAMIKGEWARKKRGSKVLSFESLDGVFAAWNTPSTRVANILAAKPTAAGATRRDKLLRSLFSGPIDADKLDYLLRDAKHTDVPYPFGIDVAMLMRCITVVVPKDGPAHDVPMIGVHAKGRVAAEFLIFARYAMFAQVYWHHTVRAEKAMLARAVGALLAGSENEDAIENFKADFLSMVVALPENLYARRPQALFPEMNSVNVDMSEHGTDLLPTDAAMLAWFQSRLRAAALPEARLCEDLLKRRVYKRLWVLSNTMDAKRWDRCVSSWEKLNRQQRNQACYEFEEKMRAVVVDNMASVTALEATEARSIIEEKTKGKIPWLLIDVPSSRPGAHVGLQYVLEGQRRQLRRDDRAVGAIQGSELWETYARDLQKAAGNIRIFCDPFLVDTVETSLDMEKCFDELEAAIMEAGT